MSETSFDNTRLGQTANYCRLTVSHVFCGHYCGRWQSALAANRLIYVFASGAECGSIGDDRISVPLLPDSWIFIPALHRVRHDQRSGLQLISIHFNVELYSHMELFAGSGRILSGNAPSIRAAFRNLAHRETGMAEAFALQSVLWRMLTEEILPDLPVPGTIENRWRKFAPLLEKISRNPCKNLSVAEMAALMKMGKESFVKHFAAETGESPKAFFNRIRAAAIAKELSDPAISVGEIAERFGFSNTFYFSRFFKRHFGVGPQAYRKKIPALRHER